MELVKLKPIVKDYIWGGNYFQRFGKGLEFERVSECWELSLRGVDSSIIASRPDTGKPLVDIVTKEDVGPIQDRFPYFPLLIKLIDAKENLSVQVHPSDEYALKYENSFGKSEMWHIISADDECVDAQDHPRRTRAAFRFGRSRDACAGGHELRRLPLLLDTALDGQSELPQPAQLRPPAPPGQRQGALSDVRSDGEADALLPGRGGADLFPQQRRLDAVDILEALGARPGSAGLRKTPPEEKTGRNKRQ